MYIQIDNHNEKLPLDIQPELLGEEIDMKVRLNDGLRPKLPLYSKQEQTAPTICNDGRQVSKVSANADCLHVQSIQPQVNTPVPTQLGNMHQDFHRS